MARYAVMSNTKTAVQVEAEVRRCGGRNVRPLSITRQVYCDLEEDGLKALAAEPGIIVEKVRKITHQEIRRPRQYLPSELLPATYATSQASLASGFYNFRDFWDPPVTGLGATIAILDSGIRKTHEGLRGKVIHEANFTSSPTVDDVFDHGTGVAYLAAGGRHAAGEESGLAPDAYLLNIKVLDDDGLGDEESVVRGIEECYRLELEAAERGLGPGDPMDLNFVNMSFGGVDDGDPDNPIRRAIRIAAEGFGGPVFFAFIAAAGNSGPGPGSINSPACDPNVIAVGAATLSPFQVWELSSRGPTQEGLVKPDFSGFGVRMLTASCRSDEAYVVKSGTSFAAPTCCGGIAAVWEGMQRQYGERFWQEFYEGGAQQVISTGALISVKPEGSLAEKDNDYGYGLPSGFVALEAGKQAVGLGSVTEMVVPIAALGMVGMMMSGMARSAS